VLESWFAAQGLRPEIRAEFQDSALLGAFGRSGLGIFAAPDILRAEVCAEYHVERIGPLGDARQRYYALTVDRRIRHAAVRAITESARSKLFAR
jgi:LysR family transcriptional activator of nhaA